MRDTGERLQPRRRWGQNFLVNQGAADAIVAAFRPAPRDLVLEVGPGRGVLTRRLAGRVAALVAIEIDPRLAQELGAEMAPHPSVEILRADVLEIDLRALLHRVGAGPGRRARVVANLPYNIATNVVRRLLAERDLVGDLLVLVQREVAERIASPPGRKTYGALSVLCQARGRVEILLRLKPGSFRPAPKVDSALVRLTLRSPEDEQAARSAAAPGALERLLRAAFAQRRKTLLNNLSRLAGPRGRPLGPEAAETLIRGAGLDPRARAEEVPVEGFLALARGSESL